MDGIDWSIGIGDPTPVGWFTVVAYFAAAWLCVRAFQSEKKGPPRPLRQAIPAVLRVVRKHWPRPPARARRALLWLVLGVFLVLLGINKQLDLQTLLTELGKASARAGGWYEQRRMVQMAFIGVVGVVGLVSLGAFGWLARGHLRQLRLPLGGFVFVVCFVVMRAASFHNFDLLINATFLGIRMNWVFELGGIGIISLGAWRQLRAARETAAS